MKRTPLTIRSRVASVLALLALVMATLASTAVAPAPAVAAAGLTVVEEERLSERLHEITVYSPALGRETTMRVLLPRGYDSRSPEVSYPVLYLLHGGIDTYVSWTDKADTEAFTDGMDVVVVMPDAGQAGFYSDHYNHGLPGGTKWHSYHIEELIPWVERTYDVRAERNGRMLAGLSMGGFGSFSYAARHPDLFVSTAAYSPWVDTNFLDPVGIDLGFLDREMLYATWGVRATEEVRWRGHNPWDLAENLGTVDTWLITGNGRDENGNVVDVVEYGVHAMAVSVHERMTELGVDHHWEDYGPGGHTWEMWERDLHQTLPQQLAHANANPPTPEAFSHTTIDRSYDIFDYRVSMDRVALEFSRLQVHGPTSFAVEGSGTAYVTTAPVLEPGTPYDVTVDGNVVTRRRSDSSGRLNLAIDLGAPHLLQQHTAAADLVGRGLRRAEVSLQPVSHLL
ncbi:putative secreted protein [Euzebya pacifica]|uniref:Putative secreted protein n=1 Tax=Euzebya pacifica TaxID=1608957 RepID=A0A346XWP0_9ACTN|nr:alpha/beta hydrolase family protein [Euzebya pacifica]AXV06637.1 putative secreted protein [Euzebya pacifica]